jgi:hypothetical protein
LKDYNSILKYSTDQFGKYIYAFDKTDGSNFRAEWSRKLSKKTRFTNGFGKFGTRTETIKKQSNPFYKAVEIFQEKYSEDLDKIFCEDKIFRGVNEITVYGEFFGSKSFAGRHDWNEDHDVKIFDVWLLKKGFLVPSDFLKIFGELDISRLIYQGEFTPNFLKLIEDNFFQLSEGVVCKGVEEQKLFMFKIKTNKWLNLVKQLYGERALEY